MAAQVKFYGGDWGVYDVDSGGSGIGFFGASFGDSVAVGAYNDSTYITNGNGSVQGANIHNWKWTHANSGAFESVSYPLSGIPNSYATLKIRFSNDDPVKCQNVKFRVYDRANVNRAQSGVVCQLAELCRTNSIFGDSFGPTGPWGSGSTTWTTANPAGSSTIYTFINQSPGISGIYGRNTAATGTIHEWFLLMSASPTSIGSKTQFGGYFSLEYL